MTSKEGDDGVSQNSNDARDAARGLLSGAEHFLVGISPQYWSHTPMNIQCLHQLGLVEGIDCLVLRKRMNAYQHGIPESNEHRWSGKQAQEYGC
jgi:hypothetical protein